MWMCTPLFKGKPKGIPNHFGGGDPPHKIDGQRDRLSNSRSWQVSQSAVFGPRYRTATSDSLNISQARAMLSVCSSA